MFNLRNLICGLFYFRENKMEDEKNPRMLLQTFPNDVLLKIANREIDAVEIAKYLLEAQGISTEKKSFGCAEIKELEKIAEKNLGIKTLKIRNSDSLDFHEISVWDLKKSLLESYELGKKDIK